MARKGKMYERVIESEFLQEKMNIKIYEPGNFNSLYESNVCMMQDGNDYFQIGRIATLSDRLHENEEIENTTFVGIHYIDRFDRLKKYHPDGEQFEAYQQFLVNEVVPFLNDLLPINPLGTVRTLIGDSLAGTISLITALNYPDMFQKVIMQSPLVNDSVLNIVKGLGKIDSLEIYHSIGLEELAVPTTKDGKVDFLTPNRQLAELFKGNNRYHYNEIEHGNHTWKFWQKELPDVLEKMLS